MNTYPLVKKPAILQILSISILKLIGWELIGTFPNLPKYIIVGAPHTSNWDFLLAMLFKFVSGIPFKFIGKASLFRWPFGYIFRSLGGIPVWRERRGNFVSQIVDTFNQHEELVIVISPEGTRSKTPYWKTGFYYMALGADVPVLLAFMDYSKKQIGVGPLIYLTGDIHLDFARLRSFYADKVGKFPDKQGAIEPPPHQ